MRPPRASRRFRGSLALLGFALALVWMPVWAGAQTGTLQGLDGPALTARELSQGSAILLVWASWSPRCRDIVERINAVEARWGRDAKVYSVNFNEDGDEARRFLAGKKLDVPTVLDADGELSKRNAITFLPGLIVYKGGQVAYAGRLPDNPEELLSKLLAP